MSFSVVFLVSFGIQSTAMKRLEKTDEYDRWARSLTDRMVAARVQVRIDRLLDGNAGDVAPVGESVSELRLHFGAG
jgi:putative addiction module killer protein